MKVINIASGSKGNCTYIGTKDNNILIDIGLSYISINQKLIINADIDMDDIDYILISHQHKDHCSAFKTIYDRHPDIKFILHRDTLYKSENNDNTFNKGLVGRFPNVDIDEDRFIFTDFEQEWMLFGIDFAVHPFNLMHDVHCVGFTVYERETKESVCHISDNGGWLKNLDDELMKNHTYYLIESNHSRELQVLDTKRDTRLKRRVLGSYGHTNNYDAIKNITQLVGDKTRHIVFTHLSEDCNSEEIANGIHQNYLDIWGKRTLFKNIKISYAKQDDITEL